MDLIAENISQYAAQYSSPESGLLQEVAAWTVQHHPQHHMLSGHVQGRFLSLLSKLIQPRRILEIGTFTGYSALCLAEGLAADGELHTLELREADAATARQFFNKSGKKDQIILHTGPASDLIPSINEDWDLVFIDADKTAYSDYYELTLPRLKKNGLMVADNVLFHGQVLETPITGKNAKAIDAFNQQVSHDDRVEQVLLTVRDGLLVVRKK
jgi:caffeoyl-CoA O-methyltransferase